MLGSSRTPPSECGMRTGEMVQRIKALSAQFWKLKFNPWHKERTGSTDLSSVCHMNSAVPFPSVSVVFYHSRRNLGGAISSLRTMA